MIKNIICEEIIEEYENQIENSKEMKEILVDQEAIIDKIYNTFGFQYGSKVETMIWNLVSEMGNQMYIKGLKDGAKLFG